jgi:hypothetical protein
MSHERGASDLRSEQSETVPISLCLFWVATRQLKANMKPSDLPSGVSLLIIVL